MIINNSVSYITIGSRKFILAGMERIVKNKEKL